MSNQTVKSSSRLWSQEVAELRAQTEMEAAPAVSAGVRTLVEQLEPGYEFSNRTFASRKDPYA